jgi:hypothetical protein
MLSILIELATECSHCGNPLPINGFSEKIFCSKCNNVNDISIKLWSSLLEDKAAEVKKFADSEGQTSKIMTGQYTFDLLYGKKNARCNKCKTDIPDSEIIKFKEAGEYKCTKCSELISIRPADKILKGIMPVADYIVSEDESILSQSPEKPLKPENVKPVLFVCPSCAGNLEIDGTIRLVVCKYCDSKIYLPDDLWFTMHPVKTKGRWYIVLNEQTLSEELPKWSSLADAAIDINGNLYFAAEDDSDVDFFIWSCTPDLKKRWETKKPKLDCSDTRIAIGRNGNLYVWNKSKNSLYILSSKDGSLVKEMKGEKSTDENPYPFSITGCSAMVSDSDNTLLALIYNSLIRFNPDGTRASLWHTPEEGEGGFFSKIFKHSDDKIKIPEDTEWPAEKVTESGDKPKKMDTYGTKMFLGWDNYIYFYDTSDDVTALAKYSRNGEQLWKKSVALKESGDKISADSTGNIFITGQDENKKSLMYRISPDGSTVDIVLKDMTEGGALRYDSGDMVLVSKEGIIYIVNTYSSIRVINPDFTVKYVSPDCKEDDDDYLKEA